MTTKDQVRTIVHVYKKLIEMETMGWSNLDTHMEMLDYLENDQLYREASVLLQEHKTGHMRPSLDVPNPDLLVPMIVESVATLLSTYQAFGIMDGQSRYILQQYLALHHIKKLKFTSRVVY